MLTSWSLHSFSLSLFPCACGLILHDHLSLSFHFFPHAQPPYLLFTCSTSDPSNTPFSTYFLNSISIQARHSYHLSETFHVKHIQLRLSGSFIHTFQFMQTVCKLVCYFLNVHVTNHPPTSHSSNAKTSSGTLYDTFHYYYYYYLLAQFGNQVFKYMHLIQPVSIKRDIRSFNNTTTALLCFLVPLCFPYSPIHVLDKKNMLLKSNLIQIYPFHKISNFTHW